MFFNGILCVNSANHPQLPMHEITFSTIDKPKLLSQVCALLPTSGRVHLRTGNYFLLFSSVIWRQSKGNSLDVVWFRSPMQLIVLGAVLLLLEYLCFPKPILVIDEYIKYKEPLVEWDSNWLSLGCRCLHCLQMLGWIFVKHMSFQPQMAIPLMFLWWMAGLRR